MTRADTPAEAGLSIPRPRRAVAVARLGLSALGLIAIAATFADTAKRAEINPFNFFGYFTMQSNIAIALVLVFAGAAAWQGRRSSALGGLVRAWATTYILITGIVSNTILSGVDGGVSLVWANWILHVGVPILVALDWTFVDDRAPVPWSRLWTVLIYPAIWCAVVLIRGADDGWVPYPFFDPSDGYGSVAVYLLAVGAVIVLVGAIVVAFSRRPGAAAMRWVAEGS